jgi:hypothetical protein
MFEDGAYGGDGGQPMSSPTESTQPSLREILNELATDTHTDLDARIAYTEGEILKLITTAKPEKLERPAAGPQRNGTAQAVRNARNKTIDEYEARILAALKGQA